MSASMLSAESISCKHSNYPVALFRKRCGDALMFFLERRQYKQPAVINVHLPCIGDTHILDAPGRANHQWLRPTEKKVENVLFDG